MTINLRTLHTFLVLLPLGLLPGCDGDDSDNSDDKSSETGNDGGKDDGDDGKDDGDDDGKDDGGDDGKDDGGDDGADGGADDAADDGDVPLWDCYCEAECDGDIVEYEETVCSDAETIELAIDIAVDECTLELEGECIEFFCGCECDEDPDLVCTD